MSKDRLRKRKQRRKTLHEIPIRMMIPNLLTFMAAASGITAIRYSAEGRWRAAAICILIACLFDGVDGRVARMLSATSKLGAELDSLSDFVSFGVAPAMLIYSWMMETVVPESAIYPYRGIFWAIALFYALCCAFRLARFNIMIEDGPTQPYWKHFFLGLPAPGGAGLAILPLIWQFTLRTDVLQSPVLGSFSLLTCGLLMAGRFPTLSAKHLRVPRHWLLPVLLVVLFTIGMFISQFWFTLGIIGIFYYLTIPLCGFFFCRMKHRYDFSQPLSSPSK